MAAAVVLCGAAAVLILAILIGDSRDLAWKSITFAFVFALFTLPAAAGVYLARRRPGFACPDVQGPPQLKRGMCPRRHSNHGA